MTTENNEESAFLSPIPPFCPVNTTLNIIGGKWKVLILYHLKDNPCRFNALQRLLPNVTQRMLTLQLRELEQDGIVHREIYQQIPPKVEYSLTEFGRTLMPVIMAMHAWGEAYQISHYSNNFLEKR